METQNVWNNAMRIEILLHENKTSGFIQITKVLAEYVVNTNLRDS